MMSLPAFVLYFLWRKLSLVLCWTLGLGIWIVVFVIHSQDCPAGRCTASDPSLSAAGSNVVPNALGLLAVAIGLQIATAIRRHRVKERRP